MIGSCKSHVIAHLGHAASGKEPLLFLGGTVDRGRRPSSSCEARRHGLGARAQHRKLSPSACMQPLGALSRGPERRFEGSSSLYKQQRGFWRCGKLGSTPATLWEIQWFAPHGFHRGRPSSLGHARVPHPCSAVYTSWTRT
ncbi:hypothetical protein MRX96_019188 [Rhipicephalus microplus]